MIKKHLIQNAIKYDNVKEHEIKIQCKRKIIKYYFVTAIKKEN